MTERNDTVPPVVGRKFRRRDGEIVEIVRIESGEKYRSHSLEGKEEPYYTEHGFAPHLDIGFDLIEMLPHNHALIGKATITLRVGLDQVSNICTTPGVEVVEVKFPE